MGYRLSLNLCCWLSSIPLPRKITNSRLIPQISHPSCKLTYQLSIPLSIIVLSFHQFKFYGIYDTDTWGTKYEPFNVVLLFQKGSEWTVISFVLGRRIMQTDTLCQVSVLWELYYMVYLRFWDLNFAGSEQNKCQMY